MRRLLAFVCLTASSPVAVDAQGFGSPSRLPELELARSRMCVPALARVAELNARMEPLARRSQRLTVLAEAIALEERSAVDTLDASDPSVARVKEWFDTDQALAQRYVTTEDPAVQAERGAGRETIKATITRAMEEVQTTANTIFQANEQTLAAAAPCDGAIFVRSAVVEACAESSGTVCDAAASTESVPPYRFVDDPASVWDIEEIRPWTAPGPLRAGPTGLEGGRTVGFTRVGNVVVTVAFSPILAPRDQTPESVLQAYQATNDSLGIAASHPLLAITPGLGVRVAVPQALDEEDGYILHFGPPEEADIVWTGEANPGEPHQASVPLLPSHVRRLVAGERLTLSAVAQTEDVPEAVYAIAVGNANQAQNTRAILNYMQTRMAADLNRLIPPS